jgi:transposase InsO family protein
VFFSFVIDAYSRMVVRWQLAAHMRTTLVLDALRTALGLREPGADIALVHTPTVAPCTKAESCWSTPRGSKRERFRRRLQQKATLVRKSFESSLGRNPPMAESYRKRARRRAVR